MRLNTSDISEVTISNTDTYTMDLPHPGRYSIEKDSLITLYIVTECYSNLAVFHNNIQNLNVGDIITTINSEKITFINEDNKTDEPILITDKNHSSTSSAATNRNEEKYPKFLVISISKTGNQIPSLPSSISLINDNEASNIPGLKELITLVYNGNLRQIDVDKKLQNTVIKGIVQLIISNQPYQKSISSIYDTEQHQEKRIRKVIEEIHKDPSKHWSLQEFSGIANLSIASLNFYFKKTTGQSPFKYLVNARIKQAKHLLKESNKSIYEIAVISGYKSDASFNKAFKNRVGITPGGYRQAFHTVFPTSPANL